jgi:hypothetical protein
MNEELKCPNCGHDVGEHGGTGCTHLNGVNLWCRCKFSNCGIHLDWLKRKYQNTRKQLEIAKKAMSNMELILSDGDGRENIHAPGDELVEALCEQEGYGFVMDSAARLWARKDGRAAFVCGPTRYMLYEARNKMREFLAEIIRLDKE